MGSVDYDPEELIEAYFERGWTDGLPVVPPTEKSIAAMLAGAGLRGDETIGEIVERGVIVSAEKLAINAVYHGLLAPHARWRSQVVRYGRPHPESTARHVDANPRAAGTPGAWTWAALMRRVLDLDVLACPRCGGRLRVLATVQDPRAVQAILAHRARSGAPAPPGPAPPAPAALP